MNAAVLHGPGQSPAFEQFPEPFAEAHEFALHVHAAALKPVDKQLAAGSHYASPRAFPCISGTDGVGQLDNGQRVVFGGCRAPYGAMAQRTVVPKAFVFPVPDGVSDELAAALTNPGVSAWLALAHRAELRPGENVLVLGATGAAGRLAVRIAKLLGAGRVVAAGRNQKSLDALRELGADATIQLETNTDELQSDFLREAGASGFQVVIDYVWGLPAEVFLHAVIRREFRAFRSETRFVQVGESAGPNLTLPAAALRSTPLKLLGTAGIPAAEVLTRAFQQVMAYAASRDLWMDCDCVPLADIERAWSCNQPGRRIVVLP